MSSPGAHFQGRWIDSQNVNLCSDNKIQSSHTEEVLFGTALPQFQRVKINSIKVGGVAGNLLPNGDRFALREVLAVSKQSRSATTGPSGHCHRTVSSIGLAESGEPPSSTTSVTTRHNTVHQQQHHKLAIAVLWSVLESVQWPSVLP